MHSTNRFTLSKRPVDRHPVADREIVFWDQHLPGFVVRVCSTGLKAYIAHARSSTRSCFSGNPTTERRAGQNVAIRYNPHTLTTPSAPTTTRYSPRFRIPS